MAVYNSPAPSELSLQGERPPDRAGLNNLPYFFDFDCAAGILFVQMPVGMALLDLTVIQVSHALQQV